MDAAALEREHAGLQARLDHAGESADAVELWTTMGISQAAEIGSLDADAVRALRPAASAALAG
jgi:hypothetical protein